MPLPEAKEALAAGLRRGAQQLLPQAIEAAGADWIDRHRHRPDDPGHRPVVRNGHRPARALTTGGGPVGAPPPRVHDWRAADEREKFRAALGPPYLRTTQSGEELVPWLYRQGVSTGDFSEAWAARRGPQAKGLSASTVTRLKGIGEQAYQDGSTRSLAGQHGVYVWADGVSFTIRREAGRPCILVLRRAPADGQKELIAIRDGQRETVRLRTEKTKGSGPRQACLAMVFKRLESASRRGRALNGSPLLAAVLRGGVFVDGVKQEDAA